MRELGVGRTQLREEAEVTEQLHSLELDCAEAVYSLRMQVSDLKEEQNPGEVRSAA